MTIVSFMDWRFDVDSGATAAYYDAIETGSADTCGCHDCENYLLLRERAFPAAIHDLLRQLSIPYAKEIEIGCVKVRPNEHAYNAFFHFAGQMLDGPDSHVEIGPQAWSVQFQPVTDSFGIGFTSRISLLRGSPPGPWVQLDFDAVLPWVAELPEPN